MLAQPPPAGVGDVGSVQRRPRALQRAVDRRDARIEQLRHLGGFPVQHLAEDQHRPLARRQVLQRRDEREADRLARLRHGRGIALRHDAPVGDRLDPGDLREDLAHGSVRGARFAQIHRPRAPLPAVEHVEANVRRDPVQPRPQRCAALEALERAPGTQERVLHRILGLERRAEHPVAIGVQLATMTLEIAEGVVYRDCRALHPSHPTTDRRACAGS